MMKHAPVADKNYAAFSFEEFLQDDYFIGSMKQPTTETSAYWEQFRKGNRNLNDFDVAKAFVQSVNRYHYTLSAAEIEEIKRAIFDKRYSARRRWKVFYWGIGGMVAAASVALLVSVFYAVENKDVAPVKPDIAAYADMLRPDTTESDIQLILSDERTLVIDEEEAVITVDTAGIIIDKKVIAQDESAAYNQLIVPAGKRGKLNLPDGTVVWINAGSRLVYPFAFERDKREIYVDGEIYIEVAEEANRPFVVRTKDLDVRVLGTRFNVNAYDAENEKKIVLVSGAVELVSKKDEEITRLLPDQMYQMENGQSHVTRVDTRKYIAWIDGIYYCENEDLGKILHKLSRYYGVEISCEPAISKVVFSGKLDLKENLTDIFKGISFTLPVSYSKDDGKYTITKLK